MDPMAERLVLAQSRLVLRDGCLLKLGAKDEDVIARHPMEEVRRLEVLRTLDLPALVITLVAGGVAALAKLGIQSPGWSWGVTVGAGLFAFFGLCSLTQRVLWIQTPDGEVRYALNDSAGDCEGFVVSLRRVLRN